MEEEEYYIVSSITKDGGRSYLSSLDMIDFSESINDTIKFSSINSVKNNLENRYLSLSYWIFNAIKKNDIDGIYILLMNKDSIIRKEKYL